MLLERTLAGLESNLARRIKELLEGDGAKVDVQEDDGTSTLTFSYKDQAVPAATGGGVGVPTASAPSTTAWQQLIVALRASSQSPAQKIALLAQCIQESGRGSSALANRYLNFAGIKFKSRMQGYAEPVDYVASDGEDVYCKFASADAFLKGYWHFIESGPYDGWEAHKNDASGYIRHIAPKYAQNEHYRDSVIGLFDEAIDLLSLQDSPSSQGSGDGATTADANTIRLAVVVGHNSKQPGASATTPIGRSEFPFNNDVADAMVAEAGHYNIVAKRFNRVFTGSYSSEIEKVYGEVAQWNPTCAIELHFNSASPDATGTEMLYAPGSGEGRKMALELAEEVKVLLGLTLRHGDGTRPLQAGDRGHSSVVALSVPTVLVEPFFGSNKTDCIKIAACGEASLGRSYLRAVRDWGTA
ncbi:hypothetical protein HFO61_07680 [Rhizobium leguminosarum]|uniref:N-acetylmuramoyl-L-alanine amidase n=1 Tax=Rhizobium leguminosarum TaxID=384 RepID=UPI001C927F1C|nr:N-acetylmuramoyl-L-alanine amidase [Rhizobium leguminosarum]MBY3175365.1 hypothetical protein [Rhizobium leguminosarum]MBY5546710.1 hypothetical protein [Rhizobium leguminosarum]